MTQDSQTPGALVPGTTTAVPLDEGALQALGLVREDLPRIAEIRLELEDLRPGNLRSSVAKRPRAPQRFPASCWTRCAIVTSMPAARNWAKWCASHAA